jgi:hypothetical protein
LPANIDHTNVTGTCFSCHNGSTAPGKTATHITSTNGCDDCHITNNWTTVRMDHTAITGSCTSCHNGVTATGKPGTHIQTSSPCDLCHSTLAWTPASFDHSSAAGVCSSCHNGTTATGTPGGHFATTQQCDNCHRTSGWATISFSHNSSTYPGAHRSSVTCVDCHSGNSQIVPWPAAAYKPDCAGCHANDYRAGEHRKVSGGANYTVSELRNCAGACHTYTDSSLTTISRSRNSEHRTNGSF